MTRFQGARLLPGQVVEMAVRACNALVAALVHSGQLTAAERVVRAMDDGATAPPNAYTLCIVMHAYGARRRWAAAREVWERLCRMQWVDTVGLNSWLATCFSCGEERLALQSFQRAKVELSGVAFDSVTFGTLISGLSSSGTRLGARRALQLWAEMVAADVPTDDAIVGHLFRACRLLDVDVALRLRVDLLGMGYDARKLSRHEDELLARLPPACEVLAQPEQWSATHSCLKGTPHLRAFPSPTHTPTLYSRPDPDPPLGRRSESSRQRTCPPSSRG